MECWRLDSGSQVFSAEEYPFHAVRYNLRALGPLWERMASTSYSFSLLITSGGGFRKEGPCISVER